MLVQSHRGELPPIHAEAQAAARHLVRSGSRSFQLSNAAARHEETFEPTDCRRSIEPSPCDPKGGSSMRVRKGCTNGIRHCRGLVKARTGIVGGCEDERDG